MTDQPGSATSVALTATASCAAFRGRDGLSSEALGRAALAERVEWLAEIAAEVTRKLILEHFNDADIQRLGAGVGPDGRPLPAKGYAAMRRLGWTAASDVHCSDRVHRMGEEAAARLLRQADHRRQIVAGITATWPRDPRRRTKQEWESLERSLPEGASKAEARNRSRQVATFASAQGHLPQGLGELEDQLLVSPQLLWSACDRQAVTLTRTTGSSATLRVRLPTSSRPRSREAWSWASIPVRLPPNVPQAAELQSPTPRVRAGRVLVDLPFTMEAPAIPRLGHQVGIGLDWGINTFLVGALARLVDQGRPRVLTDGLPLRFDAGGAVAKWHRLRREGEFLRRKIAHLERLRGEWGPHPLDARLALLRAHHRALLARQRRLGHGIAWAAARWAADQAVCSGATVIYVEDLATLEPALGRQVNARISASVRGQFQDALRHLGAKAGCAVVTVPARGTSAICPRCGRRLRHHTSPGLLRSGYHWAHCSPCHLSADRDHAAAQRISSRGLSSQPAVHQDRRTGHLAIQRAQDSLVARCLRRRPSSTARPHTHPVPSRRRVLSPPAAAAVNGQRPEGGAPKVGVAPAPGQGTSAQPSSTPPGHRPRWVSLGRGFHRNAQATAAVPRGDFGPRTLGYVPLRVAWSCRDA
ncbi:MAG: zinc ribbon domain-containing protein [Candidatus Dormibacteraeota bacterium]|nr:zinc ribbon domain-containing protein [Candidatus Dormibacteraeota bacterium]